MHPQSSQNANTPRSSVLEFKSAPLCAICGRPESDWFNASADFTDFAECKHPTIFVPGIQNLRLSAKSADALKPPHARPKTRLEPGTKIKTMKPCATLDHARGCFSRGVGNKRGAKSGATRARRLTSDDTTTFFPRAKYSYEKRKKETALDWLTFEQRL
jgi:hypothetical protein